MWCFQRDTILFKSNVLGFTFHLLNMIKRLFKLQRFNLKFKNNERYAIERLCLMMRTCNYSDRGVDIILDCVGSSFWEQNARTIALEGRWVIYGSMGKVQLVNLF